MKAMRYMGILFLAFFAACSTGSDLERNKEILAVTNLSSLSAAYVDLHFYSGSSRSLHFIDDKTEFRSADSSFSSVPQQGMLLKDSARASQFNANLPPVSPAARGVRAVPANEGDIKPFLVEDGDTGIFVSCSATLIKQGGHCNVWVDNSRYDAVDTAIRDNKVNEDQINKLAAKFDDIYLYATTLLGYEYGGEPGGSGGKDSDPRIQILVYDISSDYSPGQTGGILGYFWSKDYLSDAQLIAMGFPSYKSNNAEIFYLDAHFLDIYPDTMYSTLIHEYQHMIHFNEKQINRTQPDSAMWYNEMLAMLAEDVIGPLVGINSGSKSHVINERIPYFLSIYDWYGVNEWEKYGFPDGTDDSGLPYSTVYAFGAYLIRNYGGPQLIRNMITNNAVDENSITQALQSIDGSLSFEKALERYAEALIYSSSHGGIISEASFDKTVSSTINGQRYTAYRFDIWNMETSHSFTTWLKRIGYNRANHKGPYLYEPYQRYAHMSRYSVNLIAIPDNWIGRYDVSAQPNPSSRNIKLGKYRC